MAIPPLLTATPSGDVLELRPGGSWTAVNVTTLEALSDAVTPQPGPANYSNLVARRARMQGFTGLDYPTRVPEAFEALGRWQRDGSLVHKEDVAYGLENAPKALLRLFAGENFGKQLVKVADLVA